MTSFCVSLGKQRAKFSSAHFTIFSDGTVERLHGHNYAVTVDFYGDQLATGLLFPFSVAKQLIQALCDELDERVLIPGQSPHIRLETNGEELNLFLRTPKVEKRYLFPSCDVRVLPLDNTSSERLAEYLLDRLAAHAGQLPRVARMDVHVSESQGQSVCASRVLQSA